MACITDRCIRQGGGREKEEGNYLKRCFYCCWNETDQQWQQSFCWIKVHVSRIIQCHKRLLRLVLACTTEDIGRTRSVTLNRLLALNHWSLQLLWHVLSLMAWPWQLILIASEPHFMYYWCLPALVHVNKRQHAQGVPGAFSERVRTSSFTSEGLSLTGNDAESARSPVSSD